MAEMTAEEKYKRKAALLKKALADADMMDKKDARETAAAKAKQEKAKAGQKTSQEKEDQVAAAPVAFGS